MIYIHTHETRCVIRKMMDRAHAHRAHVEERGRAHERGGLAADLAQAREEARPELRRAARLLRHRLVDRADDRRDGAGRDDGRGRVRADLERERRERE